MNDRRTLRISYELFKEMSQNEVSNFMRYVRYRFSLLGVPFEVIHSKNSQELIFSCSINND